MSQEVRGIIAKAKGEPVTLETIVIPDPGPGEAVVAIQACGVCHTDLHYREGGINDEFPFLLGHEAAGIVESSRRGVTNVRPVILSFSTGVLCAATAGRASGASLSTALTRTTPNRKMTLTDGTELSPALGIGAFCEKTLVHSGQCTKVNPESAGHGAPGCSGAASWPVSAQRSIRAGLAGKALPSSAAVASATLR